MTRGKIRVLIDLSMAARGYCGIAQDVRLLYKTLATCPDVEVTGLLYHSRSWAAPHRFVSRDAELADRLENQARALWSLAGDTAWPPSWRWRIVDKARGLAATIRASRARLDQLEVDFFWQVIWRLFFEQTLSPDDIPLVQKGKFLLSDLSDGMIHARVLTRRRPMKIDTRGYDFLIVQGPRPFRVSPGTRLIVRYHDMIPVSQPDTMSNPWVIKWHHRAIRQTLDAGFYVCTSEPTRDYLRGVYPEARPASTTIPCMLSNVYWPDRNLHVLRSIIAARRSAATGAHPRKPLNKIPRYIMAVSTLEPRKNFLGLIQAFNTARSRDAVRQAVPKLKLLIVGSPGWKYKPILSAMREFVQRGDLIHLEGVTADELRALYTHAEAFVFPSHAEGFGFPPLEAMQCETPVIASDIPEHRWVLGDAALFCNSYDVASIAEAIQRLVASNESAALQTQLIARGRERAELYSQERCSSQWLDLLQRLKEGRVEPHGPAASQHLKSAA
jgi:glycosyltransferase involved in cell wall biosynthesis